MSETLTIGSLFSGYGGLDLAVETITGATPAWFVEYDDAPSKVLAHHWPEVPNYGDVTTVDWETMPPVDILTGGYPCQPFSQAGQRKGTNDERHLWPYVYEAIRILRPRFTLLENVAGHRSLGFDSVLGDLAEAGFDVEWTSIRASDVGAPHHRERLFILVTDSESVRRDYGHAKNYGQTNREVDALADDCETSAHTKCCDGGQRSIERGGRGTAVWCAAAGGFEHCGSAGAHVSSYAGGEEQPRGARPGQSKQERLWWGRSSDSSSQTQHFGKYTAAVRRWEHVTNTTAPAPTVPNTKGNPHLNPAFAEWMMGLPNGWVTSPEIGLTRRQQLKAIGNGVCPQQAERALRELLETSTNDNT